MAPWLDLKEEIEAEFAADSWLEAATKAFRFADDSTVHLAVLAPLKGLVCRCGKPFQSSHRAAKWCSTECFRKARPKEPLRRYARDYYTRNKAEIAVRRKAKRDAKKAGVQIDRPKPRKRRCPHCAARFVPSMQSHRYCNPKCRKKAETGRYRRRVLREYKARTKIKAEVTRAEPKILR